MSKITEQQNKIYLSIKEYIIENKISPSVRELCKINNLSSTATLHYYLKKLKDSGYIKYRKNVARSIVLLK